MIWQQKGIEVIMKKKMVLVMIGLMCLAFGGCGEQSAEQSSQVSVVSKNDTVSEETGLDTTEEDTPNLDLESLQAVNPSFRFYISIQEVGKLTKGSCRFLVGDREIRSYDNLDFSGEKGGLCIAFEDAAFGDADRFTVVIATDGMEFTREYLRYSGQDNMLGIELGVSDTNELESCLAGGLMEHIGKYMADDGSTLYIVQEMTESCLLSEAVYEVEIILFRTAHLRGTGVMDGDVIHFIPAEGEMGVYGDITFGDYDEYAVFTTEGNEGTVFPEVRRFEFPLPQ